jgi:hypothetical protein
VELRAPAPKKINTKSSCTYLKLVDAFRETRNDTEWQAKGLTQQ